MPESEDSVLTDLRWLGLTWDEGPDVGGQYGPYRQSERSGTYQAAAQRLLDEGKAYRCFCSPEELDEMKKSQEAAGEVFQYDGRWRDADPALVQEKMKASVPFTVRFKVPETSRIVIDDIIRGTVSWDAQSTFGDFILLRSTGVPVYNFCVAVDDATMGISTVIRAEEHLTNTVRQALCLDALGAPRPQYAHCSLILGDDKQKLSKRHGAASCNQYRLDGILPDAMINYLALLGWNDGTDNEIFTRDELIDAFDLERVVKSPSVFDLEKLKWVNSQHIKMMTISETMPFVREQLDWQGTFLEGANEEAVDQFSTACTAIAKQMLDTTKLAAENAKTVLGYALPASFDIMPDSEAKSLVQAGNFYSVASKILDLYDSKTLVQPVKSELLIAFEGADAAEQEKSGPTCQYTADYMAQMKRLAKELGVNGKHLFHPLRLALTGEMSGQDVTRQLALLELAFESGVVDIEAMNAVSFEERMQRLRAFCESIPLEFRQPSNNASRTNLVATENAASTSSAVATGSGPSDQNISSSDPKDAYEGPPISALDIRVGRITKVWEHPEADKLYCEEVDVGEDEPRQIASGLRPFLSPEEMKDRLVLVLCNLKTRKMMGFPSHGMVLCAVDADHTTVRFVNPPVEAKIGERVTVPDFDFESEEGRPFPENKIAKKKVLEKLVPYLATNKYGIPEFLGRPFLTSAGACTSPIPDGTVS